MAYNERLADSVRAVLITEPGVSEKRMFGGLSFLIQGNMCCGVVGDELYMAIMRLFRERLDIRGIPGARS